MLKNRIKDFYFIILAAKLVFKLRGENLVPKVIILFFRPCMAVVLPFFISLKVNSATSFAVGASLKNFLFIFAVSANSDCVAPGQIVVTLTLDFFNSKAIASEKFST